MTQSKPSTAISNTQRMLSIMTAFTNGEKIVCSPVETRGDANRDWNQVSESPIWNWSYYDYKIQKTPPKPAELIVLLRKGAAAEWPGRVIAAGSAAEIDALLREFSAKIPGAADLLIRRRYVEVLEG